MTTLKTTLTATAASLLALAVTASAADVSSVQISGYVVASYQYEKTQNAKSNDSLFNTGGANLGNFLSSGDEARLNFSSKYGAVTGNVSLFYVPNLAVSEFGLLDAYVTWDAGSGWSIQGGKFYGPFGYEAFDSPSMNAITYGNAVATLIPSNDNVGVQANYQDKGWKATIGLLDSLYNTAGNGFAIDDKDAELKDTKAIDASFNYTAIKDVTLYAAVGYQDKGTVAATDSTKKSIALYDLWGSYNINSSLTAALEYVYSSNAADSGKSASQWLGTLTYALDKQWSAALRVGRDEHVNGTSAHATQYTIAPAYKVSDHFSVRAEYSHLSANGNPSANYFGLQGVFTF